MIARLFSNVNFTGSYQDLQQPGRYSKVDGTLQVNPRSFQVQSGVKISLYQNGLATHSIFIGNSNDVGAAWYDKIDYLIVEAPAQTTTGPVYIPPPGTPATPANVPPPGYSYVQQYAGQPPAGYDAYRRPLFPIVANVPLWNPPRRRKQQSNSNNILGGDFLSTLLTVKLLGGL